MTRTFQCSDPADRTVRVYSSPTVFATLRAGDLLAGDPVLPGFAIIVADCFALLDRHGFEPIHVSHPGNSRNLRAVLHHILAMRMQQKRWYDMVRSFRLLDLQFTINLRDIMFVIARHRR